MIDPTAVIPQHRIEDDIFDYKQDEFSFLNLNYSDILQLQNKINQNNWIEKMLKTAKYSMDIMQYSWNKWVLAYDQNKQKGILSWLGFNLNWQLLALTIVFIPILFMAVMVYFQLYRKNQSHDKVLALYQHFLLQLQKYGQDISFHAGPESIKQQSIKQFPQHIKQLTLVFNYYINLRYGASPQKYSAKFFKQLSKKLIHDIAKKSQ